MGCHIGTKNKGVFIFKVQYINFEFLIVLMKFQIAVSPFFDQ